jgi:glycosyltransferase involved in cell wall biosynthesis
MTKRVPLLIGAVALLHRRGGNVHLTIVGAGALEAELRQLLGEKNLRGIVTLAGRHDAGLMPEIYRGHDVYVSASMQEGMSNAMLEAMASGLPIVTTRCEGVAELIGDNGIVVDEPQPATLAAALEELATHPDLVKTMSAAARRRAERFSWAATADAYLQLYAKVK